MCVKEWRILLCSAIVCIFVNYPVFAKAQLSADEIQEYIEAFVSSSAYAIPYSEPLSATLVAPYVYKTVKLETIRADVLKAWDDYEEAIDQNAGKKEIARLKERADRYQAVYSCLFHDDCTLLKQFEAQDGGNRKADNNMSICFDIVGLWRHKSGVEVQYTYDGEKFYSTLVTSIKKLDKLGYHRGEQIEQVQWVEGSMCSYRGTAKQYKSTGNIYYIDQAYSVEGNKMTVSNSRETGYWYRISSKME